MNKIDRGLWNDLLFYYRVCCSHITHFDAAIKLNRNSEEKPQAFTSCKVDISNIKSKIQQKAGQHGYLLIGSDAVRLVAGHFKMHKEIKTAKAKAYDSKSRTYWTAWLHRIPFAPLLFSAWALKSKLDQIISYLHFSHFISLQLCLSESSWFYIKINYPDGLCACQAKRQSAFNINTQTNRPWHR